MKKLTKTLIALALLAVVAGGTFALFRVYLPYRDHQEVVFEEDSERAVKNYTDQPYAGKTMGKIDLSTYHSAELIELFKEALVPYQNCTATIEINDDTYTYSMEKLKQHIYFQCVDGDSGKKTFEIGEEDKLTSYLVSLDKDLSVENQYAIIKGNREPTQVEVSIQCECNEKKLTKIIRKFSKKYDIAATNATIDKQFKIHPAKTGQVLDTEEIAKGLRTYLNRQTTHNYSASYKTDKIEPKWRQKDLKKVNTIVTRYTTTYTTGSSRAYNISLAASRLNGICLLPGEEISFLDVLYDDSDGKSYQKAAAYYKGKVVQADGGGICQVSTTAYNTFLLTGITAKERYPHSMPVGYAQLGLDAALSVGGKDLVVENTLDVPILILAAAKNGSLAVGIQTYKNALGAYTYKPRAKKRSARKADAYLDVYKNGKKVKTITLSHDSYGKLKKG